MQRNYYLKIDLGRNFSDSLDEKIELDVRLKKNLSDKDRELLNKVIDDLAYLSERYEEADK